MIEERPNDRKQLMEKKPSTSASGQEVDASGAGGQLDLVTLCRVP